MVQKDLVAIKLTSRWCQVALSKAELPLDPEGSPWLCGDRCLAAKVVGEPRDAPGGTLLP